MGRAAAEHHYIPGKVCMPKITLAHCHPARNVTKYILQVEIILLQNFTASGIHALNKKFAAWTRRDAFLPPPQRRSGDTQNSSPPCEELD